jgi:hypothetical protein
MSQPWLRERNEAWILSPQAQGVYNLNVSDLMIPNMRMWDRDKIESLFSLHIANRIVETPLTNVVEEDKLIWSDNRDGNYSVRSGYKVMMQVKKQDADLSQRSEWLNLWKIKAPPKAKPFTLADLSRLFAVTCKVARETCAMSIVLSIM